MKEIRIFEEEYQEEINKFIVSVFSEEFKFEQYRDEIMNENSKKYIENGGNFWFAINEDNQVIGTVCLEKINENRLMLKRMYVSSKYRGTRFRSRTV